MSGLPNGWAFAKLSELGDLVSGAGFPDKFQNQKGLEYPFFKVGNLGKVESGEVLVSSSHTINEEIAKALRATIIPVNSIVFAKIGMAIGLNRRRLIGVPSCIDNNLMAVLPSEKVHHRFLLRFLETMDFMALTQATTVPSLRKSDLSEIVVPLPPIDEQRRIVAKLEQVLGKVADCQARLEKIPKLLARFRQAVLAAEFQTDTANHLKRLDEIFVVQTGGTPSRKESKFYTGGTIPWIKTGEVQNCEIERSEEFITELGLASSNTKIFPKETLLVAMYGEGKTRGQVGRLKIEAATNQACAALVNPSLSRASNQYIFYFLLSQYHHLRAESVGGNQPNLNLSKIKSWQVPFPPEIEQEKIIHRIESLFSYADQLEARYRVAKKNFDKLTQSILAKAFRGELVPQDPNDEPASVLLERIRAERDAQSPAPRQKRGPGVKKAKVSPPTEPKRPPKQASLF